MGEWSLDWWRPTPADAEALAGAWADPEVARWTAVPPDRAAQAAARWIGGEPARRRALAAVDLAIRDRDGNAVGEVGLGPIHQEQGAAELGWWLARRGRGQGVATTAVRTLVRIALAPAGQAAVDLGLDLDVPGDLAGLGLRTVFARVHPENHRSTALAERAGLHRKGTLDDGRTLWAAP